MYVCAACCVSEKEKTCYNRAPSVGAPPLHKTLSLNSTVQSDPGGGHPQLVPAKTSIKQRVGQTHG